MPAAELTAFEADLSDLIRARHSVILVESQEPKRVVDAVVKINTNGTIKNPRQVMVYSLSKGLRAFNGPGEKAVLPEVALTQAAQASDPTIFVFFDVHYQLGAGGRPVEPGLVRALLDVAEAFKTGPVPHSLVIVAPGLPLPPELEKVVTVLDLPLPEPHEIDQVLESIIVANRDNIVVDLDDEGRRRLVQAAQGLTLWEADNAFARALVHDRRLDANDVSLILQEKRQTIRKSGLLEFIPSQGDLDDIGGLDNLKKWLIKRDGSWLPAASDWQLPPPKGLLITGVPGCGKSLTAMCVSAQWGLPLLRLDVGRVFSGLVGSSEQNMRNALKLAEAVSPSILWIDEIEKGFGSVGGSGDSGTSQRVFGTFLTWMQEKAKPVFVMATANKIEALPPEFLRKGRFDEIFFVDLPTADERADIWALHLEKQLAAPSKAAGGLPLDDDTFKALAEVSEGFSGAEIAQAVISATFDAFSERRPVSREDLMTAVHNTVPLSVTQAEQIRAIRQWAETRAVAATAADARDTYGESASPDPADVSSWRGGRAIEF